MCGRWDGVSPIRGLSSVGCYICLTNVRYVARCPGYMVAVDRVWYGRLMFNDGGTLWDCLHLIVINCKINLLYVNHCYILFLWSLTYVVLIRCETFTTRFVELCLVGQNTRTYKNAKH